MTRKPKPVAIAVRLPIELYQSIDAYAEAEDVNLSEALRRLAVQALEAQDWRVIDTTAEGTREDTAWKQPLAENDQD